MRWNPYINAILATAYVWGIALLIHQIASLHHNQTDNLIGSIAAFSLFVFSAGVMAYLFFYQPIALLVETKKGEAIKYFFKTLGTFGVITLLVLFALGLW